jgi:hypothetical protein
MCRNIRVLHNFEPPTTKEEIRSAALQYVRKVSGIAKPSEADEKVFEVAIKEIAHATSHLLHSLHAHGKIRTREEEQAKGRERWLKREAALKARAPAR